jgi:hypothetical protein
LLDGPTRFVTLTLRHRNESLKFMLDRLYRSFRKLQLTDFWQQRVTAGASFLEVKASRLGTGWHPHVHILCKGKFIPALKLKQIWKAITGDSYIVDVTLVREQRKVVDYVTKYLTKPLDSSVIRSESHLVEAINTLQGRRSLITFGSWRGTPLKPKTEPQDYEPVAYLDTLLRHAREGNLWALHVYAQIRRLPNCGKVYEPINGDDYDP